MKKVSELTRSSVTNCQEDTGSRDNNYYSLSNKLNFSETERGIIARMDRCTPDNELKIRGWQ